MKDNTESANMALWEQVRTPDLKYTKEAKVDGQQITAISGQYMIKLATEQFGPVGIGWGWNVLEERFDKGPEVFNDKGAVIGQIIAHTVRIKLWFKLNGERGEIEQYGCTKFSYKATGGMYTDSEAPKKSLTDAIKKALAMLGFCSDIYMGLFDDGEYMAELKAQDAIEKAADKVEEFERQMEERMAAQKETLRTLANSATSNELNKFYTACARESKARIEAVQKMPESENRNIRIRNEEAYCKKLLEIYNQTKARLEKPKEEPAPDEGQAAEPAKTTRSRKKETA